MLLCLLLPYLWTPQMIYLFFKLDCYIIGNMYAAFSFLTMVQDTVANDNLDLFYTHFEFLFCLQLFM